MADSLNGAASIHGRVQAFQIENGIWRPTTPLLPNLVLYDWAAIAVQLLTTAAANYRISGMYMEYQNVGSPSDTVTPPAFDRTGGIAYYNSLASEPNTDYLRVPLIASTTANSNPTLFDGDNQITFVAQSQGTVGTNGKPFSSVNNSLIYGGALVAIVDQADRTRDIIFARFYFSTPNQQVKLATSQIGINWTQTLD